jgi:hypothetical protein
MLKTIFRFTNFFFSNSVSICETDNSRQTSSRQSWNLLEYVSGSWGGLAGSGLLSSLLASAIGILFSYANLIICCLLLYFGQSRVPAACPGLAHVGLFGGVLLGSDGGWVCEHCLQMGGFV